MAPHSSTLAWKVPWMEEPGGLQSMGLLESDTTEWLHFHFSLSCIGEGNGNPLQCSCLENLRDGGAWWAAVYGVSHSQTQLKQLSSNYLGLKHMNHGLTLIVSFFFFVQTSFREFGEVGLGTYLGYIRFSQKLVGVLGEKFWSRPECATIPNWDSGINTFHT